MRTPTLQCCARAPADFLFDAFQMPRQHKIIHVAGRHQSVIEGEFMHSVMQRKCDRAADFNATGNLRRPY